MLVKCPTEVAELRQIIWDNAAVSFSKIRSYADTSNAVSFFGALKFEKVGVDPITGQSLNLIEQINQMFSDLVVLDAADDLLKRYPEKQFELQLGPSPGPDIQSADGTVVAECFAVTTVSSNDKFNKDRKKLLDHPAQHKYFYFYSHADKDDQLEKRYKKYPEIHFQRVRKFSL